MLRKAMLICVVTASLPIVVIAYPAPRDPEPPRKAHGVFGVVVAFTKPEGVRVRSVQTGSPADRAGIQEDDVILMIDGRKVQSPEEALERIAACRPGDLISVVILNQGVMRTTLVKIGYQQSAPGAFADCRSVEAVERSTGVVEGVGEEFLN